MDLGLGASGGLTVQFTVDSETGGNQGAGRGVGITLTIDLYALKSYHLYKQTVNKTVDTAD